MELKDRIRKVIKDSGLSMPQFSSKIGVARTTIGHYRDGRTPPPIDFLEKVCREFSVSRRWLILGEGDPYTEETIGEMSSGINRKVLAQVIAGVELGLQRRGTTLPPDKKADMITFLYEEFLTKEEMEPERVETLLRLVVG